MNARASEQRRVNPALARLIGRCWIVRRLYRRTSADSRDACGSFRLLEAVYKDALEYEFKLNQIPFEREKAYPVKYKDIILQHEFFADFVVYGNIILEVKARSKIVDEPNS